jgi:pimeloyl-ACP methyl ester carboxylesterase
MAHGHAAAPPGDRPARELFLVLPGLNLNPARLDSWRAVLREGGAETMMPDLAGFGAPGGPRPVSARRWLEDLSAAHGQARARFPDAAVSVLGYSLGAALALVWSRETGNRFDRALFLAPALVMRPLPRLAVSAFSMLPGSWLIPSAAPRAYRLRGFVSVGAYRALRRLLSQQPGEGGPHPRASLVALSPQDELVSPDAARSYWRRRDEAEPGGAHRLHWIVHQPRPGWLRHLVVDAETLGAAPWNGLRTAALDWLAATAPDSLARRPLRAPGTSAR